MRMGLTWSRLGGNVRRALGAALLIVSALAGAIAAEPHEETGFGSNPGNLRMFSYVPADRKPAAPLIVVLHGCKQKAAKFASDAGWLALADRDGLALLLPQQKGLPSFFQDVYFPPWLVALWGANNQNACFNWFQPEDTARDRGEALSIRQMIDAMIALYSVDHSRVYVVGLSAGGAMAAVMLAAYPERFAGGAIVAGVPYGCANTVGEALQCMNPGIDQTPAEWGRRVVEVAGAEGRIIPHLPVKKAILITVSGNEAAGMPGRQIGHHLGQHPESNKEAVQGVLIEFVRTAKQIVEEHVFTLDVADEQRLCELAFVLEVIEEAALGDPIDVAPARSRWPSMGACARRLRCRRQPRPETRRQLNRAN
jgi:poly(3-hydroxybutyrate) depolymerase